MRALLAVLLGTAALVAAAPAHASSSIRYGIQDDAWLIYGPGTLDSRLDRLQRLGVDVVRFTLSWNEIAAERPEQATSPDDPAYHWARPASVLDGLRNHGIDALVTIYGTPEWANGGRTPNWVPNRGADAAAFATAAARRFPWVRDWTVWNEPNQRRWLRPTTPAVYVQRLLNPVYAALHAERRDARVAGGVTAPRGNTGGMSPLRWIRGMKAARARLDAYAHHPYPLNPRIETPTGGGCLWWKCETFTMSTLDRLLVEVRNAFGSSKRIWLTEYAYQTNPPERLIGVSYDAQALFLGEASLRAFLAPPVDMLIHFLVVDDIVPAAWQSGLYTVTGKAKPSARAFPLPLAQVKRTGARVRLWGEVRPRKGVQTFRLRVLRGGKWAWLGGVRRTNPRGVFWVTVELGRGARVQLYSPRDRMASPTLVLR